MKSKLNAVTNVTANPSFPLVCHVFTPYSCLSGPAVSLWSGRWPWAPSKGEVLRVYLLVGTAGQSRIYCKIVFNISFESMFISVEDRTRVIQLPYNFSMSFKYIQMVITKQAGDTLHTRSYNLKDQNM